jgi:hypothetical protein
MLTFVVGYILRHVKSFIIISFVIIAVLSARAYVVDDYRDVGAGPEQGAIINVEYPSNSTAKLKVQNIGFSDLVIYNVQVNGKNATFKPIYVQAHSCNADFRVTLQNETFVPSKIYDFWINTGMRNKIFYRSTCNLQLEFY